MSKLVTVSLAVMAYVFLIYGIASFIVWDFNPGNWSVGARFFSALTAAGGMIPVVGIAITADVLR